MNLWWSLEIFYILKNGRVWVRSSGLNPPPTFWEAYYISSLTYSTRVKKIIIKHLKKTTFLHQFWIKVNYFYSFLLGSFYFLDNKIKFSRKVTFFYINNWECKRKQWNCFKKYWFPRGKCLLINWLINNET